MNCKNICNVCLLLCLLYATSCSENKADLVEDSDGVAELCVTYTENKDEYQLHLTKNIRLVPDPLWVYPEKVNCYSTAPCRSKWITSFSIDVPHEGELVQHYVHREKIGLAYRSNSHEALVSPIDSSLKLNPEQFEKLEIKLSNARESLPHYYDRLLEGEWIARQAYDASINYKRPFYAKIVGPCENLPIMANYCLSKKRHALFETKMLHDYPLYRLFSDQVRECSKSYRLKKTLYLKSQDDEVGVLSFEEFGKVGHKYIVESKILLPRPQMIDVEIFSNDFSGTRDKIEAAWTVVLECDDNRYEKRIPFAIGLLGTCERDLVVINLDPEYKQYSQGKEFH